MIELLLILFATKDPQRIPSMAFIANSLGVTCSHCHVGKTYESDEKPAKQIARAHLAMTRAINEQHFGGKLVVTCNSCHQGRVKPAATPLVANAGWNRVEPPPLPDASKVKRVAPASFVDGKGTVERFNGREAPVTGDFAIVDRRFETTLSYPPEANQALRAVDLDAYKEWKTVAVEGNAVVLETETKERFWFDATSGALLKRGRTTSTPLGELPEEIEYGPAMRRWSRADYRVTFTFAPAASGGSARQ
jgi:Photosynthetic reaction centre cytochrome C subunit